jgi:uncharacterized protein YraI
MPFYSRIFLLFLLLGTAVQADQQGIVVRQAKVYSDANSASGQVGKITAGTRVSIFERRGGWQEIFSEERSMIGWVRSYQVRAGTASSQVITEQKEDSRGFLSGLAAFSRKASGFFTQDSKATSSGTATIGVRGLSESEINSAQADFDELEKMKGNASNRKRMKKFAEAGGLKASQVAHIPGADK